MKFPMKKINDKSSAENVENWEVQLIFVLRAFQRKSKMTMKKD